MGWFRTQYLLAVGGLCVLLFAPNAGAHHSFVAVFDRSQPVTMRGVVTEVQWSNPHIWFFVDETLEDGSVVNWGFSGGAPGILLRRGIPRDAIQVGDAIIVQGFRARDGSNNASGGRVTFEDGREVFTASPEDVDPREVSR